MQSDYEISKIFLILFSHNDGHSGNLMMDDNDLTGESLIFVDFDLTQYGFRAFDWIYHLKSASHKLFVQTDGEEYFISDEDLDKWLQIYRNNLGEVHSLCD